MRGPAGLRGALTTGIGVGEAIAFIVLALGLLALLGWMGRGER